MLGDIPIGGKTPSIFKRSSGSGFVSGSEDIDIALDLATAATTTTTTIALLVVSLTHTLRAQSVG